MPNRHALLIGIGDYPPQHHRPLHGCSNDVALLRAHLVRRFGFSDAEITTRLDAAATRVAILDAMSSIAERVQRDDIVVLLYAGHGGRMWPDDDGPAIESMVPVDSGRGSVPSRDILDFEIDQWVQRLNRLTPYVTLVMDCCHAGSVTRDSFGEEIRAVPEDTRGFASWSAETGVDRPAETTEPGAPSLAGWVAGHRRAVVLAACQEDEYAYEHTWFDYDTKQVERAGAFSYFLSKELADAPVDATWRLIFERLGPALRCQKPLQNPLAEGKVDELLLGRKQAPPVSYLSVCSVDERRVTLGGGLAHGVRRGSQWTIVIPDQDGETSADIAIEVSSVLPTTSVGHADESTDTAIQAGQRAYLTTDAVETALTISPPAVHAFALHALRSEIDSEPLLRWTRNPAEADIAIKSLPVRDRVRTGDPCPHLCPLDAPYWAAVGRDGDLAVRLLKLTGSAEELALSITRDLVRLARYRNILTLQNPQPDHALAGTVKLELRPCRQSSTANRNDSTRLPLVYEAERVDIVITNEAPRQVYFTLLELGTDYRIQALAPYSGHPTYKVGTRNGQPLGGIALNPGETFSVREYWTADPDRAAGISTGLPLHLPSGFPWAADGNATNEGLLYLKLMVTSAPADFSFLTQLNARPTGHPDPSDPLELLAQSCAWGFATRSFARVGVASDEATEWTTVTLGTRVRKKQSWSPPAPQAIASARNTWEAG